MIRFFSKMRYNLATENRVARYLRYAIGEILLVVFGILIALQVNNWNENRKNNLEFQSTIESLEKDLNENISIANGIIRKEYVRDSLITLVLNRKITREMYRKDQTLRNLIKQYWYYSPVQENLINAINFENRIQDNYKSFIPDLKNLKTAFESWEYVNKAATGDIIDYDHWLADKFYWYSQKDSSAIESEIDYMLNDPFYLNKVTLFKTGYLEHNIYSITILRNLSIAILVKLSLAEKSIQNTGVNSIIKQLGLEPFNPITDSSPVNTEPTVHFNASKLFFNASNHAVEIYRIKQNMDRENGRILKPGEYYVPSTLSDGELVEVVNENQTSKMYRSVVDGYLLIE